ncbi:UvrD-helicase domain-containing protein [Candidatus Sumerlaeota bacterium]|nr:UvrD-helicase domain-containing protein [Candidatus Sumerlaeota bacterium]
MTSDLLENLNPPQREAVTHPGGPLLIIAGAGSGKTRVITHRIAWLIREQGLRHSAVFAATFTNKAAEEMSHRVQRLLGVSGVSLPIATFHSLCARMLRTDAPLVGRTERYTILDEADQRGLIKDILKSLGLRAEECPPAYAQWRINQAKMKMQTPDEFEATLERAEDHWVVDVFRQYERRLGESDAFDFEDLILSVVRLLEGSGERLHHWQSRFEHVLVDEYQDTNLVQYRLVKLLSGAHGNLCVVGDEDQSIYSWRGADLDNILSFQRDHEGAKVIRLEQNYRSTGNILGAASAVIAHNTERLGKTLWTEAGDGEPLCLIGAANEHAEAERVLELIEHERRRGTPLREIAIFYRVNALSRIFEERLAAADVPYRIFGGVRFFERREIKDLIAHLDLVENPENSVALLRVINVPRRGVGEKTLRGLVKEADRRGVSLWQALRQMVHEGKLRGKAGNALRAFVDQIDDWRESVSTLGLPGLLDRILEDTDYAAHLRKSDPLSAAGRVENIEELGQSLAEYEQGRATATLGGYLERVALTTATDDYDPDEECVNLMTLHCAKGLEFDVVVIVGMEEPIFPNRRAVEEQGRGLEEERRLFYVGLTRARKRVFLTHAMTRFLHGQTQRNLPSAFLGEIPREVLAVAGRSQPGWGGRHPQGVPGRQKSVAPPRRRGTMGMFRTGERVSHDAFGEGTILGVKGEGSMRRLVIRFEGKELVELLESYAQLERLDREET